MTERILVTGATGFLGRALVERLLESEREVAVLHRASVSSAEVLGKLRSLGAEIVTFADHSEIADLVSVVAPDTVFHLATKYVRDHRPAELDQMIEANIAYGAHLLEGLMGSSATVVTAMTFFQFRAGESAPYSLYSATKQAFLEIARYYRETKSLDVREVVLYDTFGPGDTRDKLIPHVIACIASGRRLELGPSAQALNLLFVDDVITGLLAAAELGNPTRMTIRAATSITVGGLVATVERMSGHTLDSTFADDRPTNELVTSSGDWPTPLGWQPRFSVETGLAKTLRAE
jgi:CDP-paratose synthetase